MSARKKKPPKPLWHPVHWPNWLGLFVLYLLSFLPLKVLFVLGKWVGLLLYHLAKSRRHITEVNIRLCFPEKTEAEQQAIVRQSFIDNGIGMLETGISWWQDVGKLKPRVELEGLEHFEAAMAEGRGVIMLGAHFATLDITGALLAQFLETDVMYREQKNRVINRSMIKGRQRWFKHVIERSNTRQVFRCLKKGRSIWYAADQDYGKKVSVFAPFFGIEAATISATSRVAELNNSPALFFSAYRDYEKTGYKLCLSPVLENFPSGDDREDATRVNKLIEEAIRKSPSQYLWAHRRFKTRPEGEKNPYKP